MVLNAPNEEVTKVVELTEKQKRFCEEYIKDFNGTQAMIRAGFSQKSAGFMASEYLKKPHVADYVKYLQANLGEITGITKLRILQEHAAIAFSSMALLQDSWIKLKEFNKISKQHKACIAEIEHKEIKGIKHVRIKLYDKQRALDSISRMLGYDAPTKIENLNPQQQTQALQINVYTSGPPLASSESQIKLK